MSKPIVERFLAIFSSNVLGIAITFLATPIIVRVLGTTRYGDYAVLLSVLSILLLFANAGIYDGIRKHLKESDRSQAWREHVFAFYSQVSVILCLVFGAAILISIQIGIVERFLGSRFEVYFVLIVLTMFANQAFVIARSTLMGFDREDISEKLRVADKLLFVIVGLSLLAAGFGVEGLIMGMFIANTVTATVGLAITARFVDFSRLFIWNPGEFARRRLLTFNVMSIVLFALYVSIQHIDVLLIQFFYGSTLTGYYKAALTLAEFVWFVPRIVQIALLHSTSELWSQGKQEEITNISSKVTRYSLLFTILLVIGLSALAEPTVTLYYGVEFRPAVLPLIILLPGAVGFAVARPILAIGQGKGSFRYLIYATGIAALLNLVLNLLLIPRFGLTGAAVATSIGYFSMLVFHVASARAIGFDPISDLRLPKIAITIGVASVAIFLSASIIESALLSLVIIPPAGFVVYSAVAIATGAISIDELKEFRKQIPT